MINARKGRDSVFVITLHIYEVLRNRREGYDVDYVKEIMLNLNF